jgi:hypothetical protein
MGLVSSSDSPTPGRCRIVASATTVPTVVGSRHRLTSSTPRYPVVSSSANVVGLKKKSWSLLTAARPLPRPYPQPKSQTRLQKNTQDLFLQPNNGSFLSFLEPYPKTKSLRNVVASQGTLLSFCRKCFCVLSTTFAGMFVQRWEVAGVCLRSRVCSRDRAPTLRRPRTCRGPVVADEGLGVPAPGHVPGNKRGF